MKNRVIITAVAIVALGLAAAAVAAPDPPDVGAQDGIARYRLGGVYQAAFAGAGMLTSALLGDYCAAVGPASSGGVFRAKCWTLGEAGEFREPYAVDIDTMTADEVDARIALASEPAFLAVNPPYLHAGRYAATIHGLGADEYGTATRACVQVQGADVGNVAWNPARTRVVPFTIDDTRAATLAAASVQAATVSVSLHAGACSTLALNAWTYSLPLSAG